MFRIIAMSMILLGCIGTGISMTTRNREAYRQTCQLRRMLQQILSELKNCRKPLEEALREQSLHGRGIVGVLLKETVAGCEQNRAASIGNTWEEVCEKHREEILLKGENYENLKTCFTVRGANPRQFFEQLEEWILMLQQNEKKMQEDMGQRERLYLCVGFGTGVIGVILLL